MSFLCETPPRFSDRHADYIHNQVICGIFHSPILAPSSIPSMAAILLPRLHSQAGFTGTGEWGSRETKTEAPLVMEGGLREVLDISPLCDHHTHIHTQALTHYKKHGCTRTQLQRANVLNPLLLTQTPLKHPPDPSPLHSLPNSLSIFLRLSMRMVQKPYFWLTSSEHKGSPMHPGEAPLERPPSHPGWERAHRQSWSSFISHFHFHTELSHLASGWRALYFTPTTPPTTFSRSELNDR